MYRHNRNTPLSSGHKKGDIVRDGDLKPEIRDKMLKAGTLVRISTPPLAQLPKFKQRAKDLLEAGIVTVEDFVKAEAGDLAKQVGKTKATLIKWQAEAEQWLAPDQINEDD